MYEQGRYGILILLERLPGQNKKNGYRQAIICLRPYLSHRIICKLMEREEPPDQIDHKDGSRANNRWSNLRAATPTQQKWNARLRKDNTSGYRGVVRDYSKWCAQIWINGVQHRRSGFDTPEQAAVAYEVMARKAEFFYASRSDS
jgi:HNH endonuclease